MKNVAMVVRREFTGGCVVKCSVGLHQAQDDYGNILLKKIASFPERSEISPRSGSKMFENARSGSETWLSGAGEVEKFMFLKNCYFFNLFIF